MEDPFKVNCPYLINEERSPGQYKVVRLLTWCFRRSTDQRTPSGRPWLPATRITTRSLSIRLFLAIIAANMVIDSKCQVVPGLHHVHINQPDLINSRVISFLINKQPLATRHKLWSTSIRQLQQSNDLLSFQWTLHHQFFVEEQSLWIANTVAMQLGILLWINIVVYQYHCE